MSFDTKKISAFAVFKGRKTTSLSDVQNVGKSPSTPQSARKKSASTSNTPISSRETSLTSIKSKLGGSEKKKQKVEFKKLKKMLKEANNSRPSFLPDAALQSPLADLTMRKGAGNVQLKSLRPKTSTSNLQYNLPLKANADIAVVAPATNSPMVNGGLNGKGPKGKMPSLPPRIPKKSPTSPPTLPPRNRKNSIKDVNNKGPRRRNSEPVSSPPMKKKRVRLSDVPPPATVGSVFSTAKQQPSSSSITSREKNGHVHPMDGMDKEPHMFDSSMEASKLFECLIHPVKPKKFFSELWEKKPLLVKRHVPQYNDGWFSTVELDRILREERVNFSEHLDVTSYTDGKRETHNPDGRAYAPIVWDYYQNGCSVRMMSPQTFCRNTWRLLSILQEYFGSCIGANVYLTPPGTQGFAPHYDDIEAFILQLEGKKHWRLYSPRNENETLPRFSSSNFTDEDIGKPILDVILEAGDLLYFPRGIIHQGLTMEDTHSLHITVSCNQLNTWGDLLEKMLPQALSNAMEDNIEYRKSLPRNYLNYMGVAFSDGEQPERKSFLRHVEQLMTKLISHCPVDAAVDQMGKRYIHESLPPLLTEDEKKCSIHGNGERWDNKEKRIRGAVEIDPDSLIKIIRKGSIRLVTEEDKVCIYHNLENTRQRHGVDPLYIEIAAELAPAVEALLLAYPNYTKVDDLPLDSVTEKVELATALYEKGILVTDKPLEHLSDSSDDEEED